MKFDNNINTCQTTSWVQKVTFYTGVLLLVLGIMLVIVSVTTADAIKPREPIFHIPISVIYWLAAAVTIGLSSPCLLGPPSTGKSLWVVWVAALFITYRLAFWLSDCPTLQGFVYGFPEAFGISNRTTAMMADIVFICLFVGNCGVIFLGNRVKKRHAQTVK